MLGAKLSIAGYCGGYRLRNGHYWGEEGTLDCLLLLLTLGLKCSSSVQCLFKTDTHNAR